MEYREFDENDLDDLIGSDDDADDPRDSNQTEDASSASNLLDVNDLFPNSDLSHKTKFNPLLFDLDIDIRDSDEETEENDKIAEKKKEASEEMKKKREKIGEMMSRTAPGLDMFPRDNSDNHKNPFKCFDFGSLSLEKHCEYTRRGKLLGHGFTHSSLDQILTDRFQFVRHLFPEAQSVLLCDRNDFKSIMNFLFYSISVCTDRQLSDLMIKALFDLRRNYGFKWDLSLKQINAVLTNYGASEALLSDKQYNRDNVGIKKHLEQVIKSGQECSTTFKLPRLPSFVTKKDRFERTQTVSEEDFVFCLSRFVQVVCEFLCGFPEHTDLRYITLIRG